MAINGQVIDLKGEMSLISVLLLHSADMSAITVALGEKLKLAGQYLYRSPLILDCGSLGAAAAELDFHALRSALANAGCVPVGVRHLPEELEGEAVGAGWAVLRSGRHPTQAPPLAVVEGKVDAAGGQERGPQRLLVVERPVRSGQQIYCPDGDIVVMQQTSAGSELLAGGSVHVYGSLRGRVLAGVQGDVNARIFCQRLEAELIAIAGRYRLLDEIDPALKGQAVMVYLDDEKLKIVPI